MANASTTQASSASQTTGQAIPLSYGYVWATGKRHAYFQLQDTGNHHMDFHRVGIWLLGHGEMDGPEELWINDVLAWKGNTPATAPSGFSGQTWVKAADGGSPLVFNFHRGSDATIGGGLAPSSSGPDQGVDVLWAQFPSAINRLCFSRIAYYAIMRKQPIQSQTNTHQDDPSQWTDINPVGVWRGLRCRLFDASGAMTGYAFTTNPAWHFVDLWLRRKLYADYGLDLIAGPDDLTDAIRARFNWTSIWQSAQYYDEVLTNGRRRFQGNYVFSQKTSLQACLEKIMQASRSFQGEHAGEIYLNCDMPRSSVFTFSRKHILPGTWEATEQPTHTAANRVVPQFRDLLVPKAVGIVSITTPSGGRPNVTTDAPHPFNAGDYVAIGATGTVFDREWRVYSVPNVTGLGTPEETDPTTLVLESQGSNFPTAIGAGGAMGLLYSRFKERAPEFWHKQNMLSRGALGVGIPRRRNKVQQALDLDTCTYDQASRIARYERDRQLGPDVAPYVAPTFVRFSTSMFARDASGNMVAAVRPGDRVTVDDTVNFPYAGDYEVLDGMKVRPPSAEVRSQGGSIIRVPDANSGQMDFVLGPYSEAIMYDDSDDLQAGWPSVPDSDPGNDTTFTPVDLDGGGSFVFFTGIQASGSQFSLPSSGYPATNLFAWASPGGANVKYHSMRVIQTCDADASRNLTLIYTDDIGNFWGGDVDFAALTWLSSDTPSTSGAFKWLELTLLGGEKILFGQGVVADGGSIPALPAGYSTSQMFALACAHDTPTTATHNPRIYGAYVDAGGVVHFKYSDYAGNFWSGNAKVLIFAWKNNMGTVSTETLGTMKWMGCTLTNGKKFGVGFASAVADGGSISLPDAAGDGSTLQPIVCSSRWDAVSGAGHTWGVYEASLDSDNKVHIRFGSSTATWGGWADVFALYCTSGEGLPTLVTVTPAAPSVAAGATQLFSAAVANNANPNVTWSVDGIVGGNPTVGLINSAGLYAAPAAAGTHTVTATSVADPTASGSATVNVWGAVLTPTLLTDDSGDIIYTNDGQTIQEG